MIRPIPKPALRALAERDVLADIRLALGQEQDLVLWRLSQGTGVLVPVRMIEAILRAVRSGDRRAALEAAEEIQGQHFARQGMIAGAADLIGVLSVWGLTGRDPIGRFFALEVKRPATPGRRAGKPSPEQEQWLALVRRMGGFAAVVASVDEARAALERARRGACE